MRKILVVVAALAMLGGACGSDGGGKADAAGLKKMLLNLDDMPAGFKVDDQSATDDPAADDDDDESDDSGCAELDALDTKFGDITSAEAEVSFTKQSDSTYQALSEQVEQYKSLDGANESFDAAVAAFKACKQFDSTDDEGTHTVGTMEPLSFPRLKDDTFAVHLTLTQSSGAQSATLGGDMVAVRDGDRVAMLFALSFGDNQLSASDFEALVRKAADKL